MSQNSSENKVEERIPPISFKNILNIVAYIINVTITYWSNTGDFGLTNREASDKYQILITPNGWAFAIWGIIFIGEGIFAVAQLLPKHRNKSYVLDVCYYWVGACLAQSLWAFAFAQEVMWLALILIISIGLCLFIITQKHEQYAKSVGDEWDVLKKSYFWTFMATFRIHFGWICAASTLNANILAVAINKENTVALETVALVSLVVLPVLGCYLKDNVIFSLVLSWASFAIYSKLRSPMAKIIAQYGIQTVSAFKNAALFISFHFLIFAILSGIWYIYAGKKAKQLQESVPHNDVHYENV